MTDTTNDAIPARPKLFHYPIITLLLAATGYAITRALDAGDTVIAPNALVPPMAAMLGLVLIVFTLMVLLRNLLVAIGKVSMRYFHSYTMDAPDELMERPARAFNNLMQLPTVFYAVCLLAIALNHVDAASVQLAWMFVWLRVVHAVVLLTWNFVPYRFATYTASSLPLIALGFRVVSQLWPAG